MTQLLCHLWGDYILQSDWMAQKKSKDFRVALMHAIAYMLPFALFVRPSTGAFVVMLFSHAFIDRYGLARYLVFAKNHLGPKWCVSSETGEPRRFVLWKHAMNTGYSDTAPAWLNVWLLIIADNTLHLTINSLALAWL